MCVTCGCGDDTNTHHHHHNHDHTHHHEPHQHKDVINLEAEILAENKQFANQNRLFFKSKNALALNLVSSPGSGKTTLLEETIKQLSKKHKINVIEGDQHTELDADRIRKAGANAYQINTGKACHLDGHMVGHALEHLDIDNNSYVFIENVGNLICPALFDLGEHAKIVLISVTEGEDKPLKYPDMFLGAELVIITKTDLLPYLKFDLEQCVKNIQKINSKAKIIPLSVNDPNSLTNWFNWLATAQQFYA
jgi:hydrogenase nickel incorporation protein HypB